MTALQNISANALPLSDKTYLASGATKDVAIGPYEVQWINEGKLLDTTGTLHPPTASLSGMDSFDFEARMAATFQRATTFVIESGASTGSQIKNIMIRSAVMGFAVDIFCGMGIHDLDQQPYAVNGQPWTQIRGCGAGTVFRTKDATAFSVGAEGGGERLLDFKRVNDDETFANVRLEDFTVDVQNSFGKYNAGHVIIGTQRFTTIQQRVNVDNIQVRRVNTINVPFDPNGVKQRSNISFYTNHLTSNEATQTKLTNIVIEDCNFSGGAVGVMVGGHCSAGVVGDLSRVQCNVFYDEVFIRRVTHDMKTSLADPVQKFVFCANIQIGDRGYGNRVVIEDCKLYNSIDVGVELDSPLNAQVTDVETIDCRGPGQILINYNNSAPNQAMQEVVYTRCKTRYVNLTDGFSKSVTATAGSAILTGVDLSGNHGLLEGQIISGAGIPYNATIATGGINVGAGTVTMSVVATAGAPTTVIANFTTWNAKGYMIGVYANAQGATAPVGHVTYNQCEWHHANKTNLTKGEIFYSQGTQVRRVTINGFTAVADNMALTTVTISQSLMWMWFSGVDASGRAHVSIRDVYIRVKGTTAGGEVRLMAISGCHLDMQSPTISQDLTGATSTSFFPVTFAQDGQVEGRVSCFNTEKMTFNAGWGYYGLRTDGGGVVKNMLYEDCDFTQYSSLTADVDRIITFNNDAQAAGVKYRNLRMPGAINGFDRTKITANKTVRDWEERIVFGAAGLTATMPKAARIAPGREFKFKDEFGSGGTVAANGTLPDTIDGSATKAVAANGSVTLYSAAADVAGKIFTA